MRRKSKKRVRKQTRSSSSDRGVGRVHQILLPMVAGIAATTVLLLKRIRSSTVVPGSKWTPVSTHAPVSDKFVINP